MHGDVRHPEVSVFVDGQTMRQIKTERNIRNGQTLHNNKMIIYNCKRWRLWRITTSKAARRLASPVDGLHYAISVYFSTQSGNAHAAGGTVDVANLAFISAVSEQLSVFLQGQIYCARVIIAISEILIKILTSPLKSATQIS